MGVERISLAEKRCINKKGSFFLHHHIFLPAPPQVCKFRNWPPQFWDLVLCYGFINPEVNHVAFWMRGCSKNKVCINYWFSDCWIWKPNFYYGLVDPEWFFFNYGFLNPECIFWITDWRIRNGFFIFGCFAFFLFWINTIIHVLPEA